MVVRTGVNFVRAIKIRENFHDLYQAETKEAFKVLLRKWYFWATHSRLDPIIKVAKTIKTHWEGVLAWKRSQINNGILEGLNSLLQAAKVKAREFRTFKNFRIIIYLMLPGRETPSSNLLNIFALIPFYLKNFTRKFPLPIPGLDICNRIGYLREGVRSFKHKGLEKFFYTVSRKGIKAEHVSTAWRRVKPVFSQLHYSGA